jgi:iron complex transport system substrate-binding protein
MPSRLISFLPSATEMVYALGLEDQLFGVTHECDFPPAAREKPVVLRSVLAIEEMSQREIDVAVTERLRTGLNLYQVDEVQIREIAPDLILTQELCQVCAPSGNEVAQLLASLSPRPEVLWLTPHSLGQIFDNVRQIGEATGRLAKAEVLIAMGEARLNKIAARAATASTRPRVFCMEWLDPVYCSGHWVPEMVALAGGQDALGRPRTDSVRIQWDDVVAWAPEVVVLCPCGFGLGQTVEQAGLLASYPGWADLPAARAGRIYAVDASAYFARPGPRVVEGTDLLAHLIHPELFGWHGPQDAFRRLDIDAIANAVRR